MARRRRGRRRRMPNSSVILVQIVGLGLILLMILFFRDQIAGGAGKFLDVMGSPEDVQVVDEGAEGEEAAGLGSEARSGNADEPSESDVVPPPGAGE